MLDPESIESVAREFVDFLNARGIEYALVGGFAVQLYALPRATYDVDFTIAIDRDALPAFYAAAERAGFEVPEFQKTGWLDSVGRMPLIKVQRPVTGQHIDIDLFIAEVPFLKELLARRRQEVVNEFAAWYASPEDIILLKLDANRAKDRGDIEAIFLVQGQLDVSYLRKWATQMGTLDLLEEVLLMFPAD